jgi:hypothetical protein
MEMAGFITNGPLSEEAERGWSNHDAHWRQAYRGRPEHAERDYSDVQPAYRYGYELYNNNRNRPFEDIDEADLRAEWDARNGSVPWDDARGAVRDAFTRGDIDHPQAFERATD